MRTRVIPIRTEEEVEKIKAGGLLVAGAFEKIESMIRPGTATRELDEQAAEYIYSHGAKPAFKGFQGYPMHICVSIDAQVVHGIPGDRRLKEGEIVSVDIGVEKDGYFGDAARTYPVGDVEEGRRTLMEVTEGALYDAIAQARPGNRLVEISRAVQTRAEAGGFSVVRRLVGHGIGTSLHEEPKVPNFVGDGPGPVLKAGMVLAIEPMINARDGEVVTDSDGWTVWTQDRAPSAHFEHTVVIREEGPEILTISDEQVAARELRAVG